MARSGVDCNHGRRPKLSELIEPSRTLSTPYPKQGLTELQLSPMTNITKRRGTRLARPDAENTLECRMTLDELRYRQIHRYTLWTACRSIRGHVQISGSFFSQLSLSLVWVGLLCPTRTCHNIPDQIQVQRRHREEEQRFRFVPVRCGELAWKGKGGQDGWTVVGRSMGH